MKQISIRAALLSMALGVAGLACAQTFDAPPGAVPEPRDVPYPGVMTLHVDATDIERRIFRVRQIVPVAPGRMTLLYPRWIPGYHAPNGPVHNFAGLTIQSGGRAIKWMRDPVDVYAFHIDVPEGVDAIEIQAQALTPTETAHGPVVMSHNMLRLNWYTVALYPAGHYVRRIEVNASVSLPKGWQYAAALDVDTSKTSADNTIAFKTVSFETLVDSPLIAGRHFKQVALDETADKRASRVTLHAMADEPEQLDIRPHHVQAMQALVRQADKLFGARHFDRYDFLLWMSERIGGAGIEHHRSSENGVAPRYFIAWDSAMIGRTLLAHEYAHSWNGKYRRPADLYTPNYNVPMRDGLLWVYEGQTEYWGNVLATRSGFLTVKQSLDEWASIAATYNAQVGRTWRPLQDTTNDPIIASRRPIPWRSWQRSEDYYREGALLWLDVDTLIRERSKNKRSLDTFARAFFGMNDGDIGPLTYTFDDVVQALNAVEPYDWPAFFRARLEEHGNEAPLDGIARGGYRLTFVEQQSEYLRTNDVRRGVTDLTHSLGLIVDNRGNITNVLWDGPAFKAGLTTGIDLIAVNGVEFDRDRLMTAVKATKEGAPLDVLVKEGDAYRTVRIDYRDGLRFPVLERLKGQPALLDNILTPRK